LIFNHLKLKGSKNKLNFILAIPTSSETSFYEIKQLKIMAVSDSWFIFLCFCNFCPRDAAIVFNSKNLQGLLSKCLRRLTKSSK
jgi:hypothetical protein